MHDAFLGSRKKTGYRNKLASPHKNAFDKRFLQKLSMPF